MMTQAEKLEKRLAQFHNQLVKVIVMIDAAGHIICWVIDGETKIEGLEKPCVEKQESV